MDEDKLIEKIAETLLASKQHKEYMSETEARLWCATVDARLHCSKELMPNDRAIADADYVLAEFRKRFPAPKD